MITLDAADSSEHSPLKSSSASTPPQQYTQLGPSSPSTFDAGHSELQSDRTAVQPSSSLLHRNVVVTIAPNLSEQEVQRLSLRRFLSSMCFSLLIVAAWSAIIPTALVSVSSLDISVSGNSADMSNSGAISPPSFHLPPVRWPPIYVAPYPASIPSSSPSPVGIERRLSIAYPPPTRT